MPMGAERRSPPSEEFIATISKIRIRGTCAIVLPVHDNLQLLNRHLGLLRAQTTHDFDVIIPHSPELDASGIDTSGKFGVVFIRLKESSAAIGYYAGEKYAVGNGYDSVILADIDCVPLQPHLVEQLYSRAITGRHTVFLPTVPSLKNRSRKSWAMHWYGAMHRSVLEKAGFTYVPFYFGNEDLELELRIKREGISLQYVGDLLVEHPLSKNTSADMAVQRILYELRNISLFMPRVPFLLWAHHAYRLSSLCFCDSFPRFFYRVSLAFALFREMLALRMGRCAAFHGLKIPPYPKVSLEEQIRGKGKKAAFILWEHMGEEKSGQLSHFLKGKGVRCSIIETMPSPYALLQLQMLVSAITCESILLCMHWRSPFNPALLLCRNIYIHDGKDTWALCNDNSAISRFLRFLLSGFSLAGLTLCYVLLSAVSFLRLGATLRKYGL